MDSYAQSGLGDCSGAIVVCGNGPISSNAEGFGKQEIGAFNSCSGKEHNSLWIKVDIVRSGTLGFTLKPVRSDIDVDYDFYVFGPESVCTDLGSAIRCSTTNPLQANLQDNHTGMRDEETDLSEGPGPNGNSFVRSLDVLPGESYFIVIDRPIGKSPFELVWTGSATTSGSPFPDGVEISQPEDLIKCSYTGTAEFDLEQTRMQISPDPGTEVQYYAELEDAVDESNPISGNFISSEPRKTIFARVNNDQTDCFELVDFDLVIPEGPDVRDYLSYSLCDANLDGEEEFFMNSQKDSIVESGDLEEVELSFYRSKQQAENAEEPLPDPYFSAGEVIFVRSEERGNAMCFSISEMELKINPPVPPVVKVIDRISFTIDSESLDFHFPGEGKFHFSLDRMEGPYQKESYFASVDGGVHLLYILDRTTCERSSIEVLVPAYQKFFTPDNDGYHDFWNVEVFGDQEVTAPVRIFDRYGKLLAEVIPGSRGWDGTFRGKPMPADDYWFSLILPYEQIVKGHFSLVR